MLLNSHPHSTQLCPLVHHPVAVWGATTGIERDKMDEVISCIEPNSGIDIATALHTKTGCEAELRWERERGLWTQLPTLTW